MIGSFSDVCPVMELLAYIQSDNGTQFTAALTWCFMRAGYSLQVFSTPEHPRTNGLVERQNRTLLNLLKVFHSRHIIDCGNVYNATVHASTGFTPYQILTVTGRENTTLPGYYFPAFFAKKILDKAGFCQRYRETATRDTRIS